MAKVKRGVITHARHKKLLMQLKVTMAEEKMFLELLNKLQIKRDNTLTGIEELEKEILDLYGYKE